MTCENLRPFQSSPDPVQLDLFERTGNGVDARSHDACVNPGSPSDAHRMRRRINYDPLQPINQRAWLVVQNKFNQLLESRELAAGADLRSVLSSTASGSPIG